MTQIMDEEVYRMSNLGAASVARPRAEAEEQGIEQSIEQTLLASVKNLMQNLSLTVQKAMNALSIPEADRAKYIAKLGI